MKESSKSSPFRAMHDHNRHRVLAEILGGERVTRQEIKQRTGLTHATVSRITRDFIDNGLLREGEKVNDSGSKGRRRVEVNINTEAGFVVGVCLSAFQRSISIVDVRGERRWQREIPPDVMESPERTIDYIGDEFDRYLIDSRTPRERFLGGGVVVAGSVSHPRGEIVNAPLLRWANVPIGESLSDRLGLKIDVQNVADALCLSCRDRLYGDRGAHLHIFLVHVAVGMGASLMIDRRIVQRRGDEGWIARIPTKALDRDHTLNQQLGNAVSGKAILESILGAASTDGDVTERLKASVSAANSGSLVELRAFFEAGQLLGRTLGLLTASFLPDVLVLAGPVSQALPYQEGAESGYRSCSEMIDDSPVDVVMNTMTYLDAAENLGLHRFLLPGLLSVGQTENALERPDQ